MAIRDLLWACPICHTMASIRLVGRAEICTNCRANFERTEGARIRIAGPTRTETRDPVAWEADLPPIDALPGDAVLGPEPVTVRVGMSPRPVHSGRLLIGWAERFEPPADGMARLGPDRIVIQLESGTCWDWRLETLDAVQPSSSTLQLHASGTLLSIRFHVSSVRRWEAVLCWLLRSLYERTGRGEITEFQPRIRTGP